MAQSTFRDMQDRVLDEIGKSDTTTRNRVKNNINRAYHNFVLRELWPFREKTGTLSLVQGTQEYDLETNFSDIDEQNITAVTIQGANNKKIIYWPYNQLRASQPDFEQQGQAVPERYYLKAGKIGFWPIPNGTDTILIDYFMVPTELSDDNDLPILPVAYREALIDYALSKEHDFNTDPDLAQKAMNSYEQVVVLARQNLLTQPNDTEAFRVLGPQDARNWTGMSGEVR